MKESAEKEDKPKRGGELSRNNEEKLNYCRKNGNGRVEKGRHKALKIQT